MHRSRAPNSLFAIPTSSRLRVLAWAILVGNLPNIANRARVRRSSETAPQPRQPNIANRGARAWQCWQPWPGAPGGLDPSAGAAIQSA